MGVRGPLTWGHINSLKAPPTSLLLDYKQHEDVHWHTSLPSRSTYNTAHLLPTQQVTDTRMEFKRKSHHPSLSAALTFTPNCTRNFTISVWPAHTALWRAVIPSSLGRLGSSTCDVNKKGDCYSNFLSPERSTISWLFRTKRAERDSCTNCFCFVFLRKS